MRALLIIFAVSITISANTQSLNHDKGIYELVHSLRTNMKSPAEAVVLANQLEKIILVDSIEWLKQYYVAYCYVMAAFMEEDITNIDDLALKSKTALDKADQIGGEKSEIYCLRSLMASARIMVNPSERGMKYGMESSTMLEKAKAENPNNPRVYLIEGQGLLYMPVEYGGGCKSAIPLLEIAIDKYSTYLPKGDLYPNWGKDEVVQLLANCKSN